MVKRSRRFSAVAEKVDLDKNYEPKEAMELLKEVSTAKFDETVELHIRTNVDPRHADQMIRGVCRLPHGLGKVIRVVVFAGVEGADEARAAGADFVGEDDLIEKIEAGWDDFEVGLATPQIMPKIGKLGRVLGRKGLMPNPRSGTMVQPQDMGRAVEEAKGGRTEYRTDRAAIIHSSVGKVSFTADQLVDNLSSLASAIVRERPDSIKGPFFRSAYLTTTMGPSVSLDLPTLMALESTD